MQAKDLLEIKSFKLAKCDTAINILKNQVFILEKSNDLLKENEQLISLQKSICLRELNKAENSLEVVNLKLNKENKRKIFWRKTAIIEGLVIIGTGTLMYFTLK